MGSLGYGTEMNNYIRRKILGPPNKGMLSRYSPDREDLETFSLATCFQMAISKQDEISFCFSHK